MLYDLRERQPLFVAAICPRVKRGESIGQEMFGRLLKSRPALAGTLSDLMAKRRMKTEGILSDTPGPKTVATEKEYAAGFQARLRQWFRL